MKQFNLLKIMLLTVIIAGSVNVFGECSDLHFTEKNVLRTTSTSFTRIPAGGNGGTISDTSSDPSVASVNSVTGEVTLHAPGTAVITATQGTVCDLCGGTASYTISFSSSPDCALIASIGDVVFTEDFSGDLSQWSVDFASANNCGASSSAFYGIQNGQFVVNGVRGKTCCSAVGGNNDNYLTSQNIDLSSYPAGTTVTLSYNIGVKGDLEELVNGNVQCGGTDEVEGSYSLNGGATWTIVNQFYGDGCDGCSTGNSWTATYNIFECITLPGGGNSTFKVRLRMGNQSKDEFYYLDNVKVTVLKPITEEPEEPCVSPSINGGSLPDAVCEGNSLDLICKAPVVSDNHFDVRKGWLLDDVVYNGEDVTFSGNNKVLKYYAVNACDSVVIEIGNIVTTGLTRTINAEICQGKTYDFYGTPITAAVTGLEHRFSNTSGCDSIVTLNLTVMPNINDTETPVIGTVAEIPADESRNCVFKVPDVSEDVRAVSSDDYTEQEELIITQVPAAGTVITGDTSVTVTVKDAAGNQSETTVEITIPDMPVISVNNRDRKNVSIRIDGGQRPYSYELNGGKKGSTSSGNINLGAVFFGAHSVTIVDDRGCKVQTSFEIEGIDLIPDKFFTPNADGKNDVWNIQNIKCFDVFTVEVYDRFGKLLTRYTNEFTPWDGTYLGNPMPSTDYWYVIMVEETDKMYTGHFTLLRGRK